MTLTSTGSELNTWIFWEIQFTFFYEFAPCLGPGSISWQQELSGASNLTSVKPVHFDPTLCPAKLFMRLSNLNSSAARGVLFFLTQRTKPPHPLPTCWVQHCVVARGSHLPPPQPDHLSKGKCVWNVKMKSRDFLNHFSAARRGFLLGDRSPFFPGSRDEFPECIHADICCYP